MRDEPSLRPGLPPRPSLDGWLGTRELPGYRADGVVARLDTLPGAVQGPFRLDLLILDAGGRAPCHQSRPCPALAAHVPPDERSRFVRLVAELIRHVARLDRNLNAIDPALALLCERGIDTPHLVAAAQALDDAASEPAVVAGLCALLAHALGDEEACRAVSDVLAKLAVGHASPLGPRSPASVHDLPALVAAVVSAVGKRHARGVLGEALYFELVPQADLYPV